MIPTNKDFRLDFYKFRHNKGKFQKNFYYFEVFSSEDL